jgi:hypothetical protein
MSIGVIFFYIVVVGPAIALVFSFIWALYKWVFDLCRMVKKFRESEKH